MPRGNAFANIDNGMLYARKMKKGAQYRGFASRCKAVYIQKGRRREMRLGCCQWEFMKADRGTNTIECCKVPYLLIATLEFGCQLGGDLVG